MYIRKTDSTQQYWTLPDVPGERLTTQPIYVLTSKDTFSAAEEFSYDLQKQKRALVVGETTGGGAHPIHGYPLTDSLIIYVPEGRPINPITHTDWEGKGVIPDISVSATDALSVAEKLATQKIQAEPQ
jgi:C-terminal processing protease CtpA/Prc